MNDIGQVVLNCPHSEVNAPGSPGSWGLGPPDPGADVLWQQIFNHMMAAVASIQQGDSQKATGMLADALVAGTAQLAFDPKAAFACSLGVAAAYRVLALALVADQRLVRGSWPFRRAHQIALRFQHLAMIWITHVWEKFARREDRVTGMANYVTEYIDESSWPISLLEINQEMTAVQNTLAEGGVAGHQPHWPDVPGDFRDPQLRIGIVSLCAYPEGHVLPKYATSNHGIYAKRHGYKYLVGRETMDVNRPPAWGKIKIVYQALEDTSVDWWLWFDCDTYFMNMTVTLDSLLYKYGRVVKDSLGATGEDSKGSSDEAVKLDPDFHMLVAEDHAMLNTGAFFLKSSDWSRDFLEKVWGPPDSAWIEHPWWENAAIIWSFLKDNSEKFRAGVDPSVDGAKADEMDGIYPPQVLLCPQWEFNSYHPATSRFLHDTWEEGKFAIAFNGVLSATSPEVIKVLYGNYYELSCRLNNIQDKCETVEDALPWMSEN
eukprot:TRINITY_DN19351_c0_g1_i1.p1 TRINITY_DN19351_c0_g1~~TRINITY_DN19351_c0_g1_i1.p1  ORF type:complete len:488 (+),score=71.95 TRINITY_DN19351_c0_g1_i1:69-1532(+)